jgi:hypothetical protein
MMGTNEGTAPRPNGRDVGLGRVEHAFILRTAARIERADDRSTLLALLEQLEPYLHLHFMTEEGPRGFFETVSRAAPECAEQVAALRRDHRVILAELETLLSRIAREAAVGDDLRVAIDAFVRRMRDHEADEVRLMKVALDAYDGVRVHFD